MSINCYCHPNHYECPVLYGDLPGFEEKPNYPVPALMNDNAALLADYATRIKEFSPTTIFHLIGWMDCKR